MNSATFAVSTTAPRIPGDTLKFGSRTSVRNKRRGISTKSSRRAYSRSFRRNGRAEAWNQMTEFMGAR